MEVCKEMQILRDWLDKNKIEWKDASEDFSSNILGKIDHEMWICRTHFKIKKHSISVINGYGTYGGYGIVSSDNQGLLETMGLWYGDDSVKGYLTADEVINKVNGFINYLKGK